MSIEAAKRLGCATTTCRSCGEVFVLSTTVWCVSGGKLVGSGSTDSFYAFACSDGCAIASVEVADYGVATRYDDHDWLTGTLPDDGQALSASAAAIVLRRKSPSPAVRDV